MYLHSSNLRYSVLSTKFIQIYQCMWSSVWCCVLVVALVRSHWLLKLCCVYWGRWRAEENTSGRLTFVFPSAADVQQSAADVQQSATGVQQSAVHVHECSRLKTECNRLTTECSRLLLNKRTVRMFQQCNEGRKQEWSELKIAEKRFPFPQTLAAASCFSVHMLQEISAVELYTRIKINNNTNLLWFLSH